ncbi:MAG: prepilin peptidase, partial [Candidatus Eisenbacteria bacterium]|nr:prepilin peptidase [Candidatus Eisenbacteria bacterium]
MIQTMPQWFAIISSAAFGACLGSFLNVCIYRIPRKLSVVFPPSQCPGCDTRIAPYDNVPLFGWLWLRGKCRTCKTRISPRYPIVELLTGVLFAFLAWHYGLTWELLPAMYFGPVMLMITLIDFDAYIIPDVITLSGVPLGIAASFLTPITLMDSIVGAAVGFVVLYAIGWGYLKSTGTDGMGGGDIKFAAMLGAFLGWQGVLLTIFAAAAFGSIAGVLVMAVRG